MLSMLALGPIWAVVSPGSEETTSPLRDQLIWMGGSPFCTMQETWAYSPSSSTSEPKEKGVMAGGTAQKSFWSREEKWYVNPILHPKHCELQKYEIRHWIFDKFVYYTNAGKNIDYIMVTITTINKQR